MRGLWALHAVRCAALCAVLMLAGPVAAQGEADAASTLRAATDQVRETRAAAGAGEARPLPRALADLAARLLEAGDPAGAAVLGAEAAMQAEAAFGPDDPLVLEGAHLRAIAHLRQGHVVEALRVMIPVFAQDPASMPATLEPLNEALWDALYAAAEEDEATIEAWYGEALQRDADLQAQEAGQVEALGRLDVALGANDLPGAEAAARAALGSVLADDPFPVQIYLVLTLRALAADAPERAYPWVARYLDYPAAYLATFPLDPAADLEPLFAWLARQDRPGDLRRLAVRAVDVTRLRHGGAGVALRRGLFWQGVAERVLRRLNDAEATLRTAIAAPGEMPPDLHAELLLDLGRVLEERQDFDGAEDAYTEALALVQAHPDRMRPDSRGNVLGNLGALYGRTGRLALSEKLLAEEVAATRDAFGTDSLETAQALHNLGLTLHYAGKGEAAAQALAEAETTAWRIAPGSGDWSVIATARATVLAAQGAREAGADLLAEVRTAQQDRPAGRREGEAMLLTQLAVQAAGDGALDTAQDYVAEARAVTDPADPLVMEVEAVAGAVALMRDDPAAALDALRKATAMVDRLGAGQVEARDPLALHVEAAQRMAAADPTGGADYLREAFSIAQRVGAAAAGRAMSQAAARWGAAPGGIAALTRDLQDAERRSAAARDTLMQALGAGGTGVMERNALERADADEDAARAALRTAAPDYARFALPETVDVWAAGQLLAPGEVLILYATSDLQVPEGGASTAIAITRDRFQFAKLPPRAELVDLAARLRCAAARTDPACGTGGDATRASFSLGGPPAAAAPAFDFDVAHAAYTAVLAPFAALLAGARHVVIVPDAALTALPFHLLLTAPPGPSTGLQDAPWLIRSHAVSVVPTVASLAALRARPAPPDLAAAAFLGVGDPLIGAQAGGPVPVACDTAPTLLAAAIPAQRGGVATLAALPDTRCELQAFAARLDAAPELLLHGDATEARLRALSGSGALAGFDVVSFATHGLIAGELGDNAAGLVLTPGDGAGDADDGLLTTGEIAQLRFDAEFVLLSACNTAAGADAGEEGLSGLASAFFYAGARSLLVSHWPVYSDAAVRLTTGMLETWREDPAAGRAEALRQAMLAVLDDPSATARERHPAYWAPFMIVGDGGR